MLGMLSKKIENEIISFKRIHTLLYSTAPIAPIARPVMPPTTAPARGPPIAPATVEPTVAPPIIAPLCALTLATILLATMTIAIKENFLRDIVPK